MFLEKIPPDSHRLLLGRGSTKDDWLYKYETHSGSFDLKGNAIKWYSNS